MKQNKESWMALASELTKDKPDKKKIKSHIDTLNIDKNIGSLDLMALALKELNDSISPKKRKDYEENI